MSSSMPSSNLRRPSFARPVRRAWTAADLVVLLFILLIAAGLVIPLIVTQRRNSDRVHCSYNLSRLGMAINSFSKDKGFLPPARIADDYATWAVLIAPYLEKRHADDHDPELINWEINRRYADQPEAVRADRLKQMFCPSRQHPSSLSTDGDGDPNMPGAVGDYACVSGDGRANYPWKEAKANGPMIVSEILKQKDGVIQEWRGRTKLDQASLKRGLSVTMLLGEKHVPLDQWGRAAEGDGCIYNGRNPASSARVAGPGFGLAVERTSPFNNNFGGYHPGVCLFLQADMGLRTFTTQVSEQILGQLMVREEE